MPYPKHPQKYPPEFATLLAAAEGKAEFRFEFPFPTAGEAHGKRVQLQNYLAAVERFAVQVEEQARRGRDAAKSLGQHDRAAELVEQARIWTLRATTARNLVVRSFREPPRVLVELRHAGDFGKALLALGKEAATAGLPADLIQAQDEVVAFINEGQQPRWLEDEPAGELEGREAQARAIFAAQFPEEIPLILDPALQLAAMKRWRGAGK
ncbi:MAG: hypothetical protein [Siphoviridae sp. ctdEk19]|nr:MAG: hypothetical protein [Siphoviridae sp. ctdEk19]